jgi:hypothetical protein
VVKRGWLFLAAGANLRFRFQRQGANSTTMLIERQFGGAATTQILPGFDA